MISGKLSKIVVAVVALIDCTCTEAFSPLVPKAALSPRFAHDAGLYKQSFCPSPYNRQTDTALSAWFGNDEKKDSEGKREGDSRLNSVAASAPFFDVTDTKNLEEFVAPVSNILDDFTGGWALSYANLAPETESTPAGITFLATNIAYGLCGSLLLSNGNIVLGILTEFACIASFFYHYSQLKFGQEGSNIVRLSLLADYLFACSAILVGGAQSFMSHQLPMDAVYSGTLAIAALGACWIWEEGLSYIVFHSLWHLFSAYTGYLIGTIQ